MPTLSGRPSRSPWDQVGPLSGHRRWGSSIASRCRWYRCGIATSPRTPAGLGSRCRSTRCSATADPPPPRRRRPDPACRAPRTGHRPHTSALAPPTLLASRVITFRRRCDSTALCDYPFVAGWRLAHRGNAVRDRNVITIGGAGRAPRASRAAEANRPMRPTRSIRRIAQRCSLDRWISRPSGWPRRARKWLSHRSGWVGCPAARPIGRGDRWPGRRGGRRRRVIASAEPISRTRARRG